MSNVSIIDFCDDVKKYSVGMSPNTVALNKARCAKRRAKRVRFYDNIGDEDEIVDTRNVKTRNVKTRNESDAIISVDVPECVQTGQCINIADFDYANWGEDAANRGSKLLTMLGGAVGDLFGGVFTRNGSNDQFLALMIEIGPSALKKLMGTVFMKALTKAITTACIKGATTFTAVSISIMSKIVGRVIMRFAIKMFANAAMFGTTLATAVACPPCGAALAAVMKAAGWFMIASMVFDMWDPF